MENVGYYDMYQLASVRETARQKAHIGIIPLSRVRILQLVKDGKFPKPVKRFSNKNFWSKREVNEWLEGLAKNV